jgi:SpoIIAA-like
LTLRFGQDRGKIEAEPMADPPDPAFECTVGYDADVPCVVMTWKGYGTSREFRAANERVLRAISEHKATKVLGDIKDFVLIGSDDQNWLTSDWIPRATAAGLRAAALITPTFYFNRVAVESVGQRLDRQALTLLFFDSRDAARQWLSCA